MAEYTPDNWIVIKLDGKDDPHYRVLAGWSGGFTTGDSWKLNSGITNVEETEKHYLFYGSSGSVYKCNKVSYTIRMNIAGVLQELKDIHGEDTIKVMDEDTNWHSVDWIIN